MAARSSAARPRSAGLLLYRRVRAASGPGLEVLLGHMGGPFWARKDARAWSIPKGEHDAGETALAAAQREFREELGMDVTLGTPLPLGEVRQSGGKVVQAWAVEGDVDATAASSNTFTLEWPPRSGQLREFPEMDRFGWFDLAAARERVVAAQVTFLDRLEQALGAGAG